MQHLGMCRAQVLASLQRTSVNSAALQKFYAVKHMQVLTSPQCAGLSFTAVHMLCGKAYCMWKWVVRKCYLHHSTQWLRD